MTAALFEIDAPVYSVPSLAETLRRDNGLVAVSTFSGCGGSSLGLHAAGWRIPYAVEFIPAARETYEANFPQTYVDGRDIREIEAEEILDRTGLRRGELDLLEGSPPCSSFSAAASNLGEAKRYGALAEKDYSEGVKQVTDDLFDEWLRLVDGLLPRAVIAENVPGLVIGYGRDYYREILLILRALGYRAEGGIYNAMHYGAATSRRRLVIRGIRTDVAAAIPRPPVRTGYGYSLDELFATLPTPPSEEEREHASTVGYAVGEEWTHLGYGEASAKIYQAHRCDPTRPLPGITRVGQSRGSANPMHPYENRKFTPTELAWAFGYPADFIWPGTPSQRYERIARSVAPPLYAAHGRVLSDALGGAL